MRVRKMEPVHKHGYSQAVCHRDGGRPLGEIPMLRFHQIANPCLQRPRSRRRTTKRGTRTVNDRSGGRAARQQDQRSIQIIISDFRWHLPSAEGNLERVPLHIPYHERLGPISVFAYQVWHFFMSDEELAVGTVRIIAPTHHADTSHFKERF